MEKPLEMIFVRLLIYKLYNLPLQNLIIKLKKSNFIKLKYFIYIRDI